LAAQERKEAIKASGRKGADSGLVSRGVKPLSTVGRDV
jgi:hypothetical protein